VGTALRAFALPTATYGLFVVAATSSKKTIASVTAIYLRIAAYRELTMNIRIDEGAAERLIAQRLRDGSRLSPVEANELANEIATGLKAATTSPTRAGLKGWRMIPEYLPFEQRDNLIQNMRLNGINASDDSARALWTLVYSYGRPIPDDITD
jgi:hypothetical protein